jgi:hypothetical protein
MIWRWRERLQAIRAWEMDLVPTIWHEPMQGRFSKLEEAFVKAKRAGTWAELNRTRSLTPREGVEASLLLLANDKRSGATLSHSIMRPFSLT